MARPTVWPQRRRSQQHDHWPLAVPPVPAAAAAASAAASGGASRPEPAPAACASSTAPAAAQERARGPQGEAGLPSRSPMGAGAAAVAQASPPPEAAPTTAPAWLIALRLLLPLQWIAPPPLLPLFPMLLLLLYARCPTVEAAAVAAPALPEPAPETHQFQHVNGSEFTTSMTRVGLTGVNVHALQCAHNVAAIFHSRYKVSRHPCTSDIVHLFKSK